MASEQRRLTPIQRLVLLHVYACAKEGKPAIIVTGHRKTRVVEFPVKEASGFGRVQGIATNSVTLYFLRQHGLVEEISAEAAALLSHREVVKARRYRLTPKGEAAIAPPASELVGTPRRQPGVV